MSGMAKHPDLPPDPIPKESALLKCEHCGNASRVWLARCERCKSPEVNWYEARIAKYEATLAAQDKQIRLQADLLNSYAAKLRRFDGKCDFCKHALIKCGEMEDCLHKDYDGTDPECVEGWWEDDRCKNWEAE